MASKKISALTNYAGAQTPVDLAYIGKSPFGATDDRKSTLNDLFAIITKNITDLSLGFQNGVTATVSAAGQGKIVYNDTTKTFQTSVDGGAYADIGVSPPFIDTQTIIKGSADATKLLRFEVDGFTTGTTRVLTPPNANIIIAGSAAALTSGRIPFVTTGGLLLDDGAFLWDNTNKRLGVGATPGAPIDVLANVGAIAQQWRENAGAARVQMQVPSSFGLIGTSSNHDFGIITNNSQIANFEAAGAAVFGAIAVATGQVQINAQATGTISLIANNLTATSVDIARFQVAGSNRFRFLNTGEAIFGLASSLTGKLTLANSAGATTTTIQSGNAVSTLAFTWPVVDPTSGQFLSASAPSGGVVTLSWAAVSSGLVVGTTTISSGATTRVLFDNAGVLGEYTITGTGNVAMSASPTFTGTVAVAAATFSGTIVQTSASATAFESGPNGGTNPVFRLVNNVSSAATGLSITGNAAGSGVTLTALSSGSSESVHLKAKGEGAVNIDGSAVTNASTAVLTVTGGNNANFGNGIRLIRPVSTNYIGLEFATLTTINWSIGPNASGLGFFESGSGSQTALMIAPTTRNIGIGTTSNINSKLTVFGDIGFTSASAVAPDVALARAASGVIRVTNASTGAGSLIVGTSVGAIGTSGAGVLAFTLSTAPSSSPTDTVQLYSGDAAATDHNLYTRNEAGEINRLTGLACRVSTQFDKTNTTLADVTGLTRNVEAGRSYAFVATLYTTSDVGGGVKAAIAGTATATSVIYEGITTDAGLSTQSRATALGTAVGAVTAVTAAIIIIRGTIVVNAAGTLTVQFAENVATATSSVLINSTFVLTPIS